MTDRRTPVTQALAAFRRHAEEFRTASNLADAATTPDEQAREAAEEAGNSAVSAVYAAERLLRALDLRTYLPEPNTDDRTEQVVITVDGVDLSIRGRTGDLFVHVDPDERDRDDSRRYPLTVEVGNSGENTYGEPDDDMED